jgi:2'-5' RNA ligase
VRLFFAIALSEPLRASVSRVSDSLQERLASVHRRRAVKWVERENLHVTMRFLGEVDEAATRVLAEHTREPLPQPAFELAVGGAGAFPPAGAPRVLWAGVGAGSDAARAVFESLERRLAPLRFPPEERAYTPHLTLGRVREIDRASGQQLRGWLAAVPAALGTQHVSGVTLYRSRLSPAGPRYEIVAEVPLS